LGIVFYCASKVYPDTPAVITLVAAAFFSILPDVVEIPYYFFNHRSKIMKQVMKFQHDHQADANVIWGNLSQWGLATICLYFLLK